MTRTVFSILLLFASHLGAAGLTYDFTSTREGGAASAMSGTASMEGPGARVEFVRGDGFLFQDGAVVISADGGKTLRVLDPNAKTFYTLSFEELFSTAGSLMKSMGSMLQLTFSNRNVDVKPAGPGETIEGYPTTKFMITASYDVTAIVLGSEMSSHVVMQTEVWATPHLRAEYATFIQDQGIRTGVDEIDSLIAAQSKGVEGFPLRQVTKIRTTQRGLTDEQTMTVSISNIREGAIAPSAFAVPNGYAETKSPLDQLLQRR